MSFNFRSSETYDEMVRNNSTGVAVLRHTQDQFTTCFKILELRTNVWPSLLSADQRNSVTSDSITGLVIRLENIPQPRLLIKALDRYAKRILAREVATSFVWMAGLQLGCEHRHQVTSNLYRMYGSYADEKSEVPRMGMLASEFLQVMLGIEPLLWWDRTEFDSAFPLDCLGRFDDSPDNRLFQSRLIFAINHTKEMAQLDSLYHSKATETGTAEEAEQGNMILAHSFVLDDLQAPTTITVTLGFLPKATPAPLHFCTPDDAPVLAHAKQFVIPYYYIFRILTLGPQMSTDESVGGCYHKDVIVEEDLDRVYRQFDTWWESKTNGAALSFFVELIKELRSVIKNYAEIFSHLTVLIYSRLAECEDGPEKPMTEGVFEKWRQTLQSLGMDTLIAGNLQMIFAQYLIYHHVRTKP